MTVEPIFCNVCGHRVRVGGDNREGTHYYVPAEGACLTRTRLARALATMPHVFPDGRLEPGYTIQDIEFNLLAALDKLP